ncbi:hypothetical protein [Streptomyces sp. NBC_00670]|uniref:hypothetical protein n=1 Tax=Streptomyces sp. NBC_00670 TaxID=2975804 RepID=UPI002E31FD9B|nr:hypothetical protein [Streptomyces sp. NBC_00670]
MTDRPQRPPRPDEDEDLLRFHNGDTLDNIPVVRLPPDPPQGATTQRVPVWRLAAGAVAVAGVSALAVIGALQLARGDGGAPQAAAAPERSSGAAPASTPDRSVSAAPAPSESVWEAPAASATPAVGGLERVRVVQAPETGGDPGVTYCLVYTGSSSGDVRDAILLMNRPAAECTDLLQYDPVAGAFSDSELECAAPSRPVLLTFDEASAWAGSVLYSCLTRHHGA